jgi:transcriptional regulator with XRE-family HTH domain
MDIKTLIKTKRQERGLSAAELGRLINKHRTTILKYEDGTVKDIPLTTLKSLSKVLKVPLEKLCKAG